jgi:AcrR family transcriptional regulator
MTRSAKEERHERLCREVLESAPEFILLAGVDGPWMAQLTRHRGYSANRLYNGFQSKARLLDFILEQHLALAFEPVCSAAEWEGRPMEVLRGMSQALVRYGSANLPRHRLFLAEKERRPVSTRLALAQRLVHLANNFQTALHLVTPGHDFGALGEAAGLLLAQLLHAPLWWPRPDDGDPAATTRAVSTTVDAWVCTQLGLLTGLRRPDHRKPCAARLLAKSE